MSWMYEAVRGRDIRTVGKSALQERAKRVRQKGYKARIVKTPDGYKLFVEAGALTAAGISLTGRTRRKF